MMSPICRQAVQVEMKDKQLGVTKIVDGRLESVRMMRNFMYGVELPEKIEV